MSEILPRINDIQHDEQTRNLYNKNVFDTCTCGYHSPPPGLAVKPQSHIEGCGYRAIMAKSINSQMMTSMR